MDEYIKEVERIANEMYWKIHAQEELKHRERVSLFHRMYKFDAGVLDLGYKIMRESIRLKLMKS